MSNQNLFLMMMAFSVMAALRPRSASAEETLYVQAVKASVKTDPRMDSKTVIDLNRGESVSVLSKKDMWVEVSSKSKKGWLIRLSLSPFKPVGSADLQADIKNGSLEKASRERPKGVTETVASTRGLTASDRRRVGEEIYQSDFLAVEQMEKTKVSAGELDNFIKSASLSR